MLDATVPVVVVGGYLGAGKTTMINELLVRATEPVAVIVNDFGDVNIDAALIRSVNADTIELTNGCICCAPGNSLADTLYDILERPTTPSMIVIEASGAADPSVVAGYSHARGLRPGGTIVLVDAVNAPRTAHDPLVARTFRRQLDAADLLVVTKTDSADAQVDESLRILGESTAPVIHGRPTTLRELIVDDPKTIENTTAQHDSFATETIGDGTLTDAGAIREWLDADDRIVRAKGVITFADGARSLVQVVGTFVHVGPTDLAPTGLVVIRSVGPVA